MKKKKKKIQSIEGSCNTNATVCLCERPALWQHPCGRHWLTRQLRERNEQHINRINRNTTSITQQPSKVLSCAHNSSGCPWIIVNSSPHKKKKTPVLFPFNGRQRAELYYTHTTYMHNIEHHILLLFLYLYVTDWVLDLTNERPAMAATWFVWSAHLPLFFFFFFFFLLLWKWFHSTIKWIGKNTKW